MPLTNLSQATPEEIEEAKKGKDPIKIRIMLFYDGTLNNRLNIKEREMRELGPDERKNRKLKTEVSDEDYDDYTEDSSNSYDNGRTNIAIMEPHVSEKKENYKSDYDFVYKHYIPGQGTINYDEDQTKGYAFAIGESGVPSRAEMGINEAVNSILNGDEIDKTTQYIEMINIDVFGFSRGAATARYAIYMILKGRINSISDEFGSVVYTTENFANELQRFNYVIQEGVVKVGFAGLYDTVLSYMASQILPWTTNTLKQKSVSLATKVLHLAAADEHRKDFPLHRIQSAIDAGVGEEYYLPGVHSDVGGSYNMANDILLDDESIDDDTKEYMRTTNEGNADINAPSKRNWWGKIIDNTMIINKADPHRVKKDCEDLIDQGWYKNDEVKIEDVAWDPDIGVPITSVLKVSRQGISSAYSNIPLKIMARYARGKDVDLKIRSKLERRADRIMRDESDLIKLEEKINSYISSHVNNSKPEDWKPEDWDRKEYTNSKGKKADIDKETLKRIRHKHFHFSASKMSAGYKPRFKWDKIAKKFRRERYYYNA